MNYYVRKDGSNSNAGTADNAGGAWLTIAWAASRPFLAPGDNIYVRAGTYAEAVNLTKAGTGIAPISWYGDRSGGSWLTIVDPSVVLNPVWVEDLSFGAGVYKHTSPPFTPGVLTVDGKLLARFNRTLPAPGLQFDGTANGVTPACTWINAPADAVRASTDGSGPYWDGVEGFWAERAGVLYIRFRNGDNPNSKSIRVSFNNNAGNLAEVEVAPFRVKTASWNRIYGFKCRNAQVCIGIRPDASANITGVTIEDNYLENSPCPITVQGGGSGVLVSNVVIRDNIIETNYFANPAGGWNGSSPVTWPALSAYLFNKNQSSYNQSTLAAVSMKEAGSGHLVEGNVLDGCSGLGIEFYNYNRAAVGNKVVGNRIVNSSSVGVMLFFGNAHDLTEIYDNQFENCHIAIRFGSVRRNTPVALAQSRTYIYRNRAWNPPNPARGTFIYVHHDTGSFTTSQAFIYNNSVEGHSSGLSISSLLRPVGIPGFRVFNNVMTVSNTIVHESYVNDSPTFLAEFDYNYIREVGTASHTPGSWFGSHNIYDATKYLWGPSPSSPPTTVPDFLIDETFPVWEAGRNKTGGEPDSESMAFNAWDIGSHEYDTVGPQTPPVYLSVQSPGYALQAGLVPVSVRFTRVGSTSGSLDVDYAVSGTAAPGVHYTTLSGTVTIPNGQAFADVVVQPVVSAMSSDSTVILTLSAGAGYEISTPSVATVVIRTAVASTGGFLPTPGHRAVRRVP